MRISTGNDRDAQPHETIPPNNQNELAARLGELSDSDSKSDSDTTEETDDLPPEEEPDLIKEVEEGEEKGELNTIEENSPDLKDDVDDNTISNDGYKPQSEEDNEAEKDAENQIPSSILQFILEP